MAAALIAALFAMGVFSATGVSADDPTGADNDHDHLAGLAFQLFDEDNVEIGSDGAPGTAGIPIAASDLETSHTGSLVIPRNATKVTVTATGGDDQASWGDDSKFTVMADGKAADVKETDATADPNIAANGVATIALNDGIVKAIRVTGDNIPSSGDDETEGASRYTITLTYTGYAVNGSERTAGAPVSINLNAGETGTTLFDSGPEQTLQLTKAPQWLHAGKMSPSSCPNLASLA